MRLLFAGTPEFAVPSLRALLAARELLLSIAGPAKLAVYRRAARQADESLPVSLVLDQTQTPVSVWIG